MSAPRLGQPTTPRRWVRIARRHRVEVGFILGAAAGLALGTHVTPLRPLADVFLVSLQVLGPPLAVLILGSALACSNIRLGRLGLCSLSWYVASAYAAAAIGVMVAYLLGVGAGFSLAGASKGAQPASNSMRSGPQAWPDQLHALLQGHALYFVLGVLFLMLLGARWARLDSPWVFGWRSLLDQSTQVALKMLSWLLLYAPVGVFALAALSFGLLSFGAGAPLLKVLVAVYVTQILIFGAVLLTLRALGYPPGAFLNGAMDALMTAFVTGSSVATLPVEFAVVKDKLRISPAVAGVVLPLGLAIHKLGTGAHQAVILVFAAVEGGHHLSFGWLFVLTLLTLIASVITPPISGGSPVALAVVFAWAGLPFEAMVVTAGIPLLGKLNTPLNSLGRLMSVVVLAGHNRLPEDDPRPIAV